MPSVTRLDKRRARVPVYTYVAEPGIPPVGVMRLDRDAISRVESVEHMHDFPGLVYFERDGGSLRSGRCEWQVGAGDLFVIAPGDVMGVGERPGLEAASGCGIFFAPDALGAHSPGPLLSWRAHPLLFPFVRGAASGAIRLTVPPAERAFWSTEVAAIEAETTQRQDGYRLAAAAHLVLLLVSVSRIGSDVIGDLRLNDERLLAEVFTVIEQRYRQNLSLSLIAAAVNLSPGYLTTTVRKKTGRTVQDWITERRMTEARRLLVHGDLAIADVSRMVGFADPGYFARTFRQVHAMTPRAWRSAATASLK